MSLDATPNLHFDRLLRSADFKLSQFIRGSAVTKNVVDLERQFLTVTKNVVDLERQFFGKNPDNFSISPDMTATSDLAIFCYETSSEQQTFDF